MAKKLHQANSHCSFAFKKGWLQKRCSRKRVAVVYKASAYCTFIGCHVACDITGTRLQNGIALCVEFSGEIHHKRGDKRARRIKGEERASLRSQISNCSPSTLYCQSMNTMEIERLVSGNRDGVGSTVSVYQKISSEKKKEEQRDENLIISIMMLKEEFIRMSPVNSQLPGYIQRVHCHPFGVMCYTDIGIRIYHYLSKKQALHCDATGTVVRLGRHENSAGIAPLYYALVVQHPNGHGPVAVAEYITTEHTITSVSHFLDCYRRAEAMLYGWRNIAKPKQVVIDRSSVLLNSFLRVYNLQTVGAYLHLCFRIVQGCGEDGDYSHVFIVACVSHVMHSAKRLCRRLL